MDWGSLVAFFNVALTVFLVVQLVRFVVADADLTLLWKERYGLKPGNTGLGFSKILGLKFDSSRVLNS